MTHCMYFNKNSILPPCKYHTFKYLLHDGLVIFSELRNFNVKRQRTRGHDVVYFVVR